MQNDAVMHREGLTLSVRETAFRCQESDVPELKGLNMPLNPQVTYLVFNFLYISEYMKPWIKKKAK